MAVSGENTGHIPQQALWVEPSGVRCNRQSVGSNPSELAGFDAVSAGGAVVIDNLAGADVEANRVSCGFGDQYVVDRRRKSIPPQINTVRKMRQFVPGIFVLIIKTEP